MRHTLQILRHAKSSWDHPELDDHERPLAPRGRRAAPAMGRWLAERGPLPDRVLCSDAVRALQTWELVGPELGHRPEVVVEPGLYLSSWSSLLEHVHATDPEVATLMVVGHNPGLQDLALALTGEVAGKRARADRLESKLPTCALVELSFAGDWSEVSPGAGRLERFIRPKDLPGARERGL